MQYSLVLATWRFIIIIIISSSSSSSSRIIIISIINLNCIT